MLDVGSSPEFVAEDGDVSIPRPAHGWSVVIPFFNERDYLPATLASLAAQSVRAQIILVDNGSTDGSARIAQAACRDHGLDYRLVHEPRAGKTHALAAGMCLVRTPFVATCDADTLYPRDYLTRAQRVLEQDGCVVAGAYYCAADADPEQRARVARKICTAARALPRQCHTGGAGQAFRTDALRRAGGFDAARWGYVLEDHEIIHRVLKHGTMGYALDLWCSPSPRERDRDSIRWTLAERLLYSALAPRAGDWFFYRFLAARLRARSLTSDRIRERPHQTPRKAQNVASYPVCG